MIKYVLGATALLLAVPATAATTFKGSYDVTANNPGNPGLEILTEELADPFNFTLSLNQSTTFDLFRIWTEESSVNALPWSNDDIIERPIKVDFTFVLPTGPGGAVSGTTDGINLLVVQYGKLEWTNGGEQTFTFGNNNVLKVKLHDTNFNGGLGALAPGKANGANVSATFTLTAVPEPATWAMMIGGFGLAGAAVRRRKTSRSVLA